LGGKKAKGACRKWGRIVSPGKRMEVSKEEAGGRFRNPQGYRIGLKTKNERIRGKSGDQGGNWLIKASRPYFRSEPAKNLAPSNNRKRTPTYPQGEKRKQSVPNKRPEGGKHQWVPISRLEKKRFGEGEGEVRLVREEVEKKGRYVNRGKGERKLWGRSPKRVGGGGN